MKLSSIFKPGSRIKQYFAGWEVLLNGDDNCRAWMQTQCVDKGTAMLAYSAIELTFKNEVLTKVIVLEEGEDMGSPDDAAVGTMRYEPIQPHTVYSFIPNDAGLHQTGGPTPAGFTLPECDCAVPFQYIGLISNQDSAFNWLPFDVHLSCPVCLNMDKVYLDYTDPEKPLVINRAEVESYGYNDSHLNKDSKIEFPATKFSAELATELDGPLGHSGVPTWMQAPQMPRCPKTGNLMKFLCQLKSDSIIKIDSGINIYDEQYIALSAEQLNFWSSGDLYVFFEPTAKTACYIIQHT